MKRQTELLKLKPPHGGAVRSSSDLSSEACSETSTQTSLKVSTQLSLSYLSESNQEETDWVCTLQVLY